MRRLLGYATAMIMVAVGTIMLGSSPASAALPRCTTYVYVWDFTHTTEIQHGSTDNDNIYCENVPGDTGAATKVAVRVLQESLNHCYGPNGQFQHLFSPDLSLDGQYGPKTTAAVRALQQHLGVGVDGKAGPNTRTYMSHWDYKHEQCTVLQIPIRMWPW